MNSQIFLNGISLEQLATALQPLLTTKQPEVTTPENNLLTRDEVCKLLSINKTSLWKHTKSQKLKSYGIGNRIFYKYCEVLEAVKPINH